MFQCGDRVLYGMHGICEIIRIENMKISGKRAEYYVLQPLAQPGATYFVPTQNQAAVAKMHPILTRKELNAILHCAEVKDNAWINDENQRKQHYCNLLTSGDRVALVRMVYAICKHEEHQAAEGKRLHLCDENFLRDAKKLLDSEFSLVLDIPREDVSEYVKTVLDKA